MFPSRGVTRPDRRSSQAHGPAPRPRARLGVLFAAIALALGVFIPPAAIGAAGNVRLDAILAGYSRPVLVTHAPGAGREIFIVEQRGRILRATFEGGQWRKLGVFLDLRTRVVAPPDGGAEQGLLGLAFHPEYASNGLLYVDYTRRGEGGARGDTVIAEYRRLSAGQADPSSHRVVMTIAQPYANHNGGHLAFGPDGYLYIGMGDGGSGGDNGQRLGTLLGKILRIDPRDPDGAGPRRYRVPSTNPLVGRPGRDEIWASGLRNPWRFSFDRRTGDLWIGDVGQSAREEIDRSRARRSGIGAGKGRNYGWDRCEGRRRYPATGQRCRFGTLPVHDYPHGAGRCSVTGGYVHRGPSAPAWRGLYVAGDYCGRLFILGPNGGLRLSRNTGRGIVSFGEDAAGRLFAADIGGTINLVRFSGARP